MATSFPGLAIGHGSHFDVSFGLRVACAILEASHVERIGPDEGWGFPLKPHVTLQRIPNVVLGLPDRTLVVVVNPDKHFLLSCFCHALAAVAAVVTRVALEVVGYLVGEVREHF